MLVLAQSAAPSSKTGDIDVWVWKQVWWSDHHLDPTYNDLGKGRARARVLLSEGQVLIEAVPSVRTRGFDCVYRWAYLSRVARTRRT